MEKTRNSNVELLRIVLIIFVLILHLNNESYGGIFRIAREYDLITVNRFSRLFESFCICAVDCFLIITGYFSITSKKAKISKVLDLIYLSLIYNLLNYLLSFLIGDIEFSIKHLLLSLVPRRYFITFYIITYLFSPFINKFLLSINEKEQKIFILLFIALYSVYPSFLNFFRISQSDISTVCMSGNEMGYNIMTFILCYVIGAYIRLHNVKFRNIYLIPVYLLSTLIMTKFQTFWNYDSVFCILNALCLFLIFNNFSFQSKLINYLAKSVFGVYILHCLNVPLKFWNFLIKDSVICANFYSYLLYLVYLTY